MAANRWPVAASTFLVVLALSGCRTASRPPPVNLSEPGWRLRQGQALWQSKKSAPEIAGEVVLASNPGGHLFIQFLKNPLPLLSAEIDKDNWRIEFIPEKRQFSGRGAPPKQLIWLHLLRALQQLPIAADLGVAKTSEGGTRIANSRTGETVTLFLNDE